jgi:hypothetical protein
MDQITVVDHARSLNTAFDDAIKDVIAALEDGSIKPDWKAYPGDTRLGARYTILWSDKRLGSLYDVSWELGDDIFTAIFERKFQEVANCQIQCWDDDSEGFSFALNYGAAWGKEQETLDAFSASRKRTRDSEEDEVERKQKRSRIDDDDE